MRITVAEETVICVIWTDRLMARLSKANQGPWDTTVTWMHRAARSYKPHSIHADVIESNECWVGCIEGMKRIVDQSRVSKTLDFQREPIVYNSGQIGGVEIEWSRIGELGWVP